ncbi:hypothetical protein [Nocardia sp. BMG51109]|uniref:hypothetical protein n=1 Tax=Nocardia sp. BMG51109 TaxID=1056816 RepID=UPI0012EBE2A5|nr:hypothetical protein [Nocardia sp. BMG51109]
MRRIDFPAARRGLAAAAAVSAVLMAAGCGGEDAGATKSAAAAPVANTPPEVIGCSFDKPAVRPPDLILACADLGVRVERIEWQSWGPDKAEGDGIEHLNTCDPNCAAGHFIDKPVHLILSDVIEPGHVFTKATTIDEQGVTLTQPLTKR